MECVPAAQSAGDGPTQVLARAAELFQYFGPFQYFGRGRAPLCQISKKKVVACVNVSRPTLRVKTLTRGRAPLCQISKKKVVACVKFWGDPRPVSNYGRPPGPVSKCQISAGPRAPTIPPLHRGSEGCAVWGVERVHTECAAQRSEKPGVRVRRMASCIVTCDPLP